MVFVSHVLEDIAKLCDRVIWLDNCTIRMSGKPQEVLDAYVQDNK